MEMEKNSSSAKRTLFKPETVRTLKHNIWKMQHSGRTRVRKKVVTVDSVVAVGDEVAVTASDIEESTPLDIAEEGKG